MLLILALSGCGDSCKRLNCENGSYCHEGECICAKWYSGDECQLFYNRNYEGDYVGEYTYPEEQNRALPDIVTLTADEHIPNRVGLSTGIYLEFETDSTLVIPLQSVVDYDTLVLSGEGKYGHDFLEFTYYVQPESSNNPALPGPRVVQFKGMRVVEKQQQ